MYFQFAEHPINGDKFDVIYINPETAESYFDKGHVIYVDTNGPKGLLLPPLAFCKEYVWPNVPSFLKAKGASWEFETIYNWIKEKSEQPFHLCILKDCKDSVPYNYIWGAKFSGKFYTVAQ